MSDEVTSAYRNHVLRRASLILALVISAATLLIPRTPHPRTCPQTPIAEHYEQADMVFRGKVMEMKLHEYIVVEPEKIWKGDVRQSPLKIHYVDRSGTNRVAHEVAKEYVFFLMASGNAELSMDYCSFSDRLNNAALAKFMRKQPSRTFSIHE